MGTKERRCATLAVAAITSLTAQFALAETAADQQKRFEAEARAAGSALSGFSAQRGEAFFKATHGAEWSCASCHTPDPLAPGRHAKTGKPIAPLAPAGDAERFTSLEKVEKWFRRNCNDVLDRACTAQEKGDILAYLMALSQGARR